MRFLGAIVISLILLRSCGQKKANLATDESVPPDAFIASFPERKLPYTISQQQLAQAPGDSFLINRKLVARFVPDSVFELDFRKNDKIRFHALGRVTVKNGESYLFVRAAGGSRILAYLLVYDNNNEFRVAMPVIRGNDRRRTDDFLIDRRYVLSLSHTRKGKEGQALFRKEVYIYNTAGVFTLVMTESNEEVEPAEIYDPLDTLPRTHPLSGNYLISRNDFITIRDGKSSNRLQFFMHMEKDNGECTGELKGDMDIVKPGIAHYNKADDHCVLEFSFRGNKLQVRELEACGNHRGVRCVFSGTYLRKKVTSSR